MPFNAMRGGLTFGNFGSIPLATLGAHPWQLAIPFRTLGAYPWQLAIPYAPTGDRTPNSGFKDPRDDHFTIRADSIRVSYL